MKECDIIVGVKNPPTYFRAVKTPTAISLPSPTPTPFHRRLFATDKRSV